MKPCRENPEMWFPALPVGVPTEHRQHKIVEQARFARDACLDCDFMVKCGELGMLEDNLRHGIWGGMLSAERMIKAGLKPSDTDARLLELVNGNL